MSPRPPRRLRRALLVITVLALLLAGFAADLQRELAAPLRIEAVQTYELPPGSRVEGNLARIDALGLFASGRQRAYLALYARLNREAAAIKAGEYALEPGLTGAGLLALWASGKTVQHELRLIEGWRFTQALAALRANPDVQQTLADRSSEEIMQALGRPGVHAEGRLFPDTYRFSRGTTDLVLLRNAMTALDRALQEEWSARAPGLPYATPDQALVMASIVEKESARSDERAQIAGVFVRRLRLGMRLQTDPTVIYGLGDAYDGDIRSADLVRDTPYNTYTREGLPPTPICLPGREAIHAALHPADAEALYFVSRGDGSHQFSATLEEHNAAVRRFQLKAGGTR